MLLLTTVKSLSLCCKSAILPMLQSQSSLPVILVKLICWLGHSGVKPSPGFSREYALHKCYYCNFTHFDKSQVTVHQKRHISKRTFCCRHGCGESFTHHSAELKHCRSVHGGLNVAPVCSSSHVQEGGYIVRKRKVSEMNV